jgi:Domain of unknown function (DUF5664)
MSPTAQLIDDEGEEEQERKKYILQLTINIFICCITAIISNFIMQATTKNPKRSCSACGVKIRNDEFRGDACCLTHAKAIAISKRGPLKEPPTELGYNECVICKEPILYKIPGTCSQRCYFYTQDFYKTNSFPVCPKAKREIPPVVAQVTKTHPSPINNTTPTTTTTARKNDSDKPMITLIEPTFIKGIAEVMTFGAKKYAADNWKTGEGLKVRRCLDASLRHIFSFVDGEDLDPESQCCLWDYVCLSCMGDET